MDKEFLEGQLQDAAWEIFLAKPDRDLIKVDEHDDIDMENEALK